MRVEPHSFLRAFIVVLLGCISGTQAISQSIVEPEIPRNFKLDMQTAARLRPQLAAASIPASGKYSVGRVVFDRLVAVTTRPANLKFTWELRVVEDGQLNAYASPDGAVYVESGLAELVGSSAGLWAAILSHEIAHVIRRDWARRYLFQNQLQEKSGFAIVLGDPGLASASWSSNEKASQDMGGYCRQLELEADEEGLMLMARAGYHPDFVLSLHHLLHAQDSGLKPKSLAAMHPCWEERDRDSSRAYVEASIEFNRRWPAWYASPGGNPPTLVFAEQATVRRTGSAAWEIIVPLRCQNLAGAVEVVLQQGAEDSKWVERLPETADPDEIRELTGCTSPRTTVTLRLDNVAEKNSARWNKVYVVDAWGSVLARADLPRMPR